MFSILHIILFLLAVLDEKLLSSVRSNSKFQRKKTKAQFKGSNASTSKLLFSSDIP
jgi:hypothetical protein